MGSPLSEERLNQDGVSAASESISSWARWGRVCAFHSCLLFPHVVRLRTRRASADRLPLRSCDRLSINFRGIARFGSSLRQHLDVFDETVSDKNLLVWLCGIPQQAMLSSSPAAKQEPPAPKPPRSQNCNPGSPHRLALQPRLPRPNTKSSFISIK